MKKFTKEQEEAFAILIEEAEKDMEENGTLSEEEFWELLEESERRKEAYTKNKIEKKQNIKSNIVKCFGKMSKRFIRI